MAQAKGTSRSQSAKGRKSSSTRSASSRSSSSSGSSKSASSGGNSRSAKGAMELLRADQQAVQKMFKQFKKLCRSSSAPDSEKEKLAQQICSELTIHTQIEEEIFYPAVREAIDEHFLLEEAEVEHDSAKELIRQIGEMDAGDELFEASVIVLGEHVNHHIEEEQNEMFPAAKQAKLDNKTLGQELQERKQELMQEYGTGSGRAGSGTARRSGRSRTRQDGARVRA